MGTARYVVAVVTLAGVGFAIPYWYRIHPLHRSSVGWGPDDLPYRRLDVGAHGSRDVPYTGPNPVRRSWDQPRLDSVQLICRRHLKFQILAGLRNSRLADGIALCAGHMQTNKAPQICKLHAHRSGFTNYLVMYTFS